MDPSDLLKHLVCALSDSPDAVTIDSHVTEFSATFDIHVAPDDVGKVLGRQGAHARYMRRLFRAIYKKEGKSLNLQVIDPRR